MSDIITRHHGHCVREKEEDVGKDVKYAIWGYCPFSGGHLSDSPSHTDQTWDTYEEAKDALHREMEHEAERLSMIEPGKHWKEYVPCAWSIDKYHPDSDGTCHTPFESQFWTLHWDVLVGGWDEAEISTWSDAQRINEDRILRLFDAKED